MLRYCHVRIGLLTFTFGLACAWFINGSKYGVVEVPVSLPESQSEQVFIINAKYRREMPISGGGAGGNLENHPDFGCSGCGGEAYDNAK